MTDRSKLPSGFRYAGVRCGIKPSGAPDISLIVADQDCVGAGVYTQNQIVAAPVLICRNITPSSRIRAVVTNSGNANACTGSQGMDDAQSMCRLVSQFAECDPDQVLVMSTGIIGQNLPMDRVESGIKDAASNLGSCEESFIAAADAILTTDKDRKIAFREIALGGSTYNIAAMAKGAGMIAPNMATMLAVVLTDAPLRPTIARDLISKAAQASFNRVSVDGHQSTNDTLLLLSSNPSDAVSDEATELFATALNSVCIELAKELVADGEGASHLMEIRVSGAANSEDAEEIARTVGASPLVKTAITGGDPNWGRIISATGYAKARIEPEKVSLQILGTTIYRLGAPVAFDAALLSSQMKQADEVLIDLTVGDGTGTTIYWASDLTTEYVTFNSEYTT